MWQDDDMKNYMTEEEEDNFPDFGNDLSGSIKDGEDDEDVLSDPDKLSAEDNLFGDETDPYQSEEY